MTTYLDSPQSSCRLGIARGDITPPVGIYHRMWGAARHDRSAGVHRPLTATAIVFQQASSDPSSTTQQVLIALDHCLLAPSEIDKLVTEIQRKTGITREVVLVVHSHTHAAGLMSRDRVELPGGDLIPAYLDSVHQTVGMLVGQAITNLQDVTITYATGRCDLAGQRDFFDEQSNQYVCGYNPSGLADDTVLVARVTGTGNKTLATLVNYACHPTSLAWDNQLISPDFPGAMREVVEDATGAPCVFVQGAAGDLGPRDGFVGDVDVADRNGRQLGYAVLSALHSLGPPETRFQYTGPVVSGATIGTWKHVALPDDRQRSCKKWCVDRELLDLNYRAGLPKTDDLEAERAKLASEEQAARERDDEPAAADLRALVERKTRVLARLENLPAGESYPFQVVLWRLGDAIWLAMQGEPYNLLQRSIRERFAGTPIIVGTVANGSGTCYLPPAELYGTGIYEESISVLEAGSLERLIEECTRRIENLGIVPSGKQERSQ